MILTIRRALGNRNIIFLLALALGFLWDTGADHAQRLIVPGLAVVMTISTMGITGDTFRSARSVISFSLIGIAASFFLHGIILVGLIAFLIQDRSFWIGFILIAAVPPAVAVIPFALFLRGDMALALLGTIGGYLGALIITPLIAVSFLGTGFISPAKLLLILGELIVGPLLLSRILVGTGLSKRIDPYKGPITNWSFALVIYIITGLNRDIFVQDPLSVGPVAVVAFLTTFILGWAMEKVGNCLRWDQAKLKSLMLLTTFKNYGLAGALAIVFFEPRTAVPATVTSAVGILYFIWLEVRAAKSP